jgi:glycosyltransferase involved in cell wall biosynthesis
LYARGIRVPQLQAAGIPILELPVRGLLSRSWLAGARALRRYVREHRIELLHTFDAPMDMVAIPIGWASRVPVLVKSHLWYRRPLPRTHKLWLAATDRMVDAIVVNSRAVQSELVDDHGISPDATSLCYNGVDSREFHPADAGQRSTSHSVTIGAVCALREEKRLDVLLEAFARLRREGVEARLLLVGGGPMLGRLQDLRRSLQIEAASEFHPTTSDVASWLRQIDIFVLSSDTESFPNALLEAMACGCCVVASRVGGVPELVRHATNGLLFEAGDVNQLVAHLRTVASDAGLRRTLGAAAERTARDDFSIERNVQCTVGLYERLLSSRTS